MEDAHTGELDIDGKNSAFFGVYDGAPHCEKRLYFAATAHHHHNGAQIGLCAPNSLLFSAMLYPLRTWLFPSASRPCALKTHTSRAT